MITVGDPIALFEGETATRKAHLRIETDSERGKITLRLIGRLQAEQIGEVKKEIDDRSAEGVCLKEVTLVDIDVVRFLAGCEDGGVAIVNCPAYIRAWIDRERQERD